MFYKILGVTGVILLAGVAFNTLNIDESNGLGSVQRGGEYNATTTSANYDPTLLVTGQGTLGSIIIPIAAAGRFHLYNASTTQSSLRTIQATSSLPILAVKEVSQAAGTYTYDVQFSQGLLLVPTAGTQATTTITYR
jgi:hypothetical protein